MKALEYTHSVFNDGKKNLPLLLADSRVDSDTREITLPQKLVQLIGTQRALDEDDYLVEFQVIQKITEFAILLLLAKLDVVLLKTVECEFGVVIDVNLEWVTHKFLADGPNFL